MDIAITTYNLHGFNQGKIMLPTICESSDIILMQEHWLYDDELDAMNGISSDFVSFCTSSLFTVESDVADLMEELICWYVNLLRLLKLLR